jgi:predicted acylesterase/phospholipase RssA
MKTSRLSICVVIGLCISAALQAQQKESILVISGGGARGAWGAGLASYLTKKEGRNYRLAYGTSTGSLMGPLVLLHKFDTLERAYTTVTQRSIFNVNPFNSEGGIRALNGIWRGLFYRTLGESKNLRTRIRENFTRSDYDRLAKSGKVFYATVTNMSDYKVYYMSSRRYSYDSTVNWIWASANQPVFMSIYETEYNPELRDHIKNKCYWQDGGLREAVPLAEAVNKAIENKIFTIDVIVHGPKHLNESHWDQKGVLTGLERTIDVLTVAVKEQNIEIGRLLEKLQNCKEEGGADASGEVYTLNIYYMEDHDYNLLSNSLLFKPDIMRKLWDSGSLGHARTSTFKRSAQGMKNALQ